MLLVRPMRRGRHTCCLWEDRPMNITNHGLVLVRYVRRVVPLLPFPLRLQHLEVVRLLRLLV